MPCTGSVVAPPRLESKYIGENTYHTRHGLRIGHRSGDAASQPARGARALQTVLVGTAHHHRHPEAAEESSQCDTQHRPIATGPATAATDRSVNGIIGGRCSSRYDNHTPVGGAVSPRTANQRRRVGIQSRTERTGGRAATAGELLLQKG